MGIEDEENWFGMTCQREKMLHNPISRILINADVGRCGGSGGVFIV